VLCCVVSQELIQLRKTFPGVPVLAATAVATELTKTHILSQLGMVDCVTFKTELNRPNLRYEVKAKKDGGATSQEIVEFIKTTYPNQSGIIYCLSKKDTQEMADELQV
jgi:bloom syndrome protein